MGDFDGTMPSKLKESFDIMVKKITSSSDPEFVADAFADHSLPQKRIAIEKVIEMLQLFEEATREEFRDICAERKMTERLNRFHRLCEIQGAKEVNGKFVATKPVLLPSKPEVTALEQRLKVKREEAENLRKLLEKVESEKQEALSHLSEKQKEVEEVQKILASAGETARQQQEALMWASRRSALKRRKSSRPSLLLERND